MSQSNKSNDKATQTPTTQNNEEAGTKTQTPRQNLMPPPPIPQRNPNRPTTVLIGKARQPPELLYPLLTRAPGTTTVDPNARYERSPSPEAIRTIDDSESEYDSDVEGLFIEGQRKVQEDTRRPYREISPRPEGVSVPDEREAGDPTPKTPGCWEA